jgi:hypothetical protein
MNDAIVLLAISQIVCLSGMAYLYMQVQGMRRHPMRPRTVTRSPRVQGMEHTVPVEPDPQPVAQHARAQAAYTAPRTPLAAPAPVQPVMSADAASIAARMAELGVDIPSLARRMRKSEEEVRLMLRRQGVVAR